MAASISATLIPCLKSFNQLQKQVERKDYTREGEVSSTTWGDELGRLRVWAANIGAHQTGQSSLDFRLRDASHISTHISKLLRDLEQSLHDVFDELSEKNVETSEDDELSAAWPSDQSTTELQQLHSEVVNIIDCLYQLSMVLRKPAQHDMLVGSRTKDKEEFEYYDQEHVRNMHPKTEKQVVQRLGRAITRRRKYLFYRERHHRKLEKGIEEVQGIQRTITGSVLSETIATEFKTPNLDFEETSSNTGTQTSYAPSLIDGGRITIPPPPKESIGGKPFECPYCFFVMDIKSKSAWIRHIFKDIKPYVCTFPDCSIPDRLYDSRREWYSHETTEHGREDFQCHLCKDILRSSKHYERHVGRHLEELALFVLPRIEMDDAEDDRDCDVVDPMQGAASSDLAPDSTSGGSSMEDEQAEQQAREAAAEQAAEAFAANIEADAKRADDFFAAASRRSLDPRLDPRDPRAPRRGDSPTPIYPRERSRSPKPKKDAMYDLDPRLDPRDPGVRDITLSGGTGTSSLLRKRSPKQIQEAFQRVLVSPSSVEHDKILYPDSQVSPSPIAVVSAGSADS